MEYTIEEFHQAIRIEVEHLKTNLTSLEKSYLNSYTYDPSSKERCIYGMATGHCNSERAKELTAKTYRMLLGINDVNEKIVLTESFIGFSDSYTPLEIYINSFENSANTVEIVEYIKGDTDTYTLHHMAKFTHDNTVYVVDDVDDDVE